MDAMDIRIVFMGSPDFALPTLNALHEKFDVVGVVTQPDRPAGRGRRIQPPEVKELAQLLGLPVIQPVSLRDTVAMDQIRAWSPDVIVVAAFGQILRQDILDLPSFGCLNVHASLLPRWRGAAPVQAAILNDEVTGVTIMKMDRGLDTGPILSQESLPITDEMTAGILFDILAQKGADLLVKTLPDYMNGEIIPQSQNEDEATYAPRLQKEDGRLDFSEPARFLARKVRAFHPWPGAFSFYEGERLKIYRAYADEHLNFVPGKRIIVDDKPAIGTVKGVLVLEEVQLAGKSRVSGADFLRGAKDWIEERDGG